MTTTTPDITTGLSMVRTSGEAAARHERHTELVTAICVEGFHLRQGDVILTCLGLDAKHGKPISERQLAPGTSQGSRHVAEGDVEIFARDHAHLGAVETAGRKDRPEVLKMLTGPLLKVGVGQCRIAHPEHREYTLPAGTVWGVTYELDEATQQRALD